MKEPDTLCKFQAVWYVSNVKYERNMVRKEARGVEKE